MGRYPCREWILDGNAWHGYPDNYKGLDPTPIASAPGMKASGLFSTELSPASRTATVTDGSSAILAAMVAPAVPFILSSSPHYVQVKVAHTRPNDDVVIALQRSSGKCACKSNHKKPSS